MHNKTGSAMRTFSGLENKTMETTNIQTNYQQQSISSNNYSTSLNLKFARSNTSPNRTMTNGSIMNGNFNRYYHAGTEVNGNGNLNHPNMKMETPGEDKFEVPLPFGYHLDLDFLRVCDGESNSEETIQKLKELKKTRRKQRKELEALMGIKQEQYRKKRLASKGSQTTSPIPPNITSTLSFRHTPSSGQSPTPNNFYHYNSHRKQRLWERYYIPFWSLLYAAR